jgi:hypothetical protein
MPNRDEGDWFVAHGAWFARRNERLRVTLHARCVSRDEGGADRLAAITLVNITPEGCCMATGGATLVPGTAVLIRLESGEALTGLVRWCDGEKAGIEFEHYLPQARVDYLRREHSTFLSETDHSQLKVQRSVS